MVRKIKIIGLISMVLLAASCSKLNPGDCFKSTGKIKTQNRDATPFTFLDLYNNVDVFISYESTYSIEVRAGENIIPGIKTTISGNTLTIKNENSCNWVRSYESPIEVYLGMPEIDSIRYQASGNVTSLNQFPGDTLRLQVLEGAGSIDLWLDMLTTRMSLEYGTVDLTMRGYSHLSYLYSGGYGPANLSGLETTFTFMQNNSTNICRVRASNTLVAEISNVGDVYYSGDPTLVYADITGTGQLIKE